MPAVSSARDADLVVRLRSRPDLLRRRVRPAAAPLRPRTTAHRGEGVRGRWAIAVAVLGYGLLLVVRGMATEGLLPAVAVPGSAVAVGVVACALVVRRHNARLDRPGGDGTDR